MGMLTDFFGGGIVDSVTKAVDTFIETPDEKAAHELKKRALDMSIALKQMEVNEVEAAHRSIFVAGWRPAVGWVCAAALGYTFILQPFLVYIMALTHPAYQPPPNIDLSGLYPVLLGMLGLGGLRTFEKIKGKAK